MGVVDGLLHAREKLSAALRGGQVAKRRGGVEDGLPGKLARLVVDLPADHRLAPPRAAHGFVLLAAEVLR
jgi:hypothetical protein